MSLDKAATDEDDDEDVLNCVGSDGDCNDYFKDGVFGGIRHTTNLYFFFN